MERRWWHGKTAYQVYPKSFFDSNGDGIGDVPGIIEKLDYIRELGAEILWLSPIYCSPLADQGFVGSYVKQWDLILTAALLAMVPMIVIFLIGQKQIMSGMVEGAVK